MPMMPMSDGTALHYRFDGEATHPVLILSNSLGATLDMWEPQMAALVTNISACSATIIAVTAPPTCRQGLTTSTALDATRRS